MRTCIAGGVGFERGSWEQAEVAEADEAGGQDMKEEAA
jgi:hypothetical protein